MSVRKIKIPNGNIRWEIRVYESGRGSKQICKRFEKKSDAEIWLQDFNQRKAELERNPFSSVSFEDRTFLSEAQYWLMDGQFRFSHGHIVKSKSVVREIDAQFGVIPIKRLTPEFLSRYQQSELKRGLKPASVNRKTEIVIAVLNHSVKHRRIPFNPASGFKKLAKRQMEMSSWSAEEASSFLGHVSETNPLGSDRRWVYVVYLLALNTGLRAGEIWGLRVCDIQASQGTITVHRQLNRITMEYTLPKSKRARVVPCNQVLLTELNALILMAGAKGEETIFKNRVGLPVCHDNFSDRQFQKDILAWGGSRIRFHDLRHTATTLLISSGVDLKTVKEICGHSDISTTMNYVHLVSGAIERVAQTFSVTPEMKEVSRNLKRVP